MTKKRVYIAGPLGFSEVGRYFMYDKLVPLIEKCNYTVLDPWKLTDESLIQSALVLPYGRRKQLKWRDVNKVIAENNANAIRSSDFVLAVLDGSDVDSGTAAEIGFAYGVGKRVIGYRGDFRIASDNEGSTVNLQVEGFIEMSGGLIIKNIGDLEKVLRSC